jgi:hypothetical protein
MIETIFKIFIGLVLLFSIYAYISDDDYHKIIDSMRQTRYNCSMLIGGWHPDVPASVIEECRKQKVKYDHN